MVANRDYTGHQRNDTKWVKYMVHELYAVDDSTAQGTEGQWVTG